MINSSLPVQFYYDILLAENIKPRQFQKLWDYFNFTSHPCVPGVAISAGTRIIGITVNKKITGQIESGKVPQWLLRDGGKNENSPVQHQYCSAGEAHLLVCRDKKGHTVRRGKNFINQREAWIWTYLAEVLHPAVVPSQGQELRGASERRAVSASRKSGATWQEQKEKYWQTALPWPFACQTQKAVASTKKKQNKKTKRGTRRRLWFNPFFLRHNTLSVGLSNHLAARLRFHIHSACLSGKAWLTALPALSYIQNLAHKED